ncbi:MAG TPA: multicopper oxidase domain-containing protein [Terriglobales bacterium]|nr:multicopper oxidase domain-containing protein [Terriglobales bacterium]
MLSVYVRPHRRVDGICPGRRARAGPGVQAIFLTIFLLVLAASPSAAATRHYYIAAEDVTWDFAPTGMDLLHGRSLSDPWAKQTKWEKTRFIEYTDGTFSIRKPQPEWLGILGPIIRGEVGDTIIVDFFNRSRRPHSIHPHGLRYDKANEGALYLPSQGRGAMVPPGGHFTYHWFVNDRSGPGPDDPSSIVWWYHSHVDEPTETNAGLLGPIIITAKGQAREDGSPKDVDREFVTLFMIFDQLGGKDAGLFYTINGYIFGNLPGLHMIEGERVRWYLLAMGNEKDMHSPHWHGEVVQYGRHHTDVIELLPGSMATADMLADNPGTWMLHCHVSEHMESGMMATYTISQPQACASPIHFAAADFWNNSGKFQITVKNTSSKPLQGITVSYDYLQSPQIRRRPFNNLWNWHTALSPGQEQTFVMPGWLPQYANKAEAWALFPQSVTFKDGTRWQPQNSEQCFELFWKNKDHPQLTVLPTAQVELDED